MVPHPHPGGGLAPDSPCTSNTPSTGAVCGMQLPKSVLPRSEDCAPLTALAKPNPAVLGIESVHESAGLSTRNGDFRLKGDRTLDESVFDCMVRRILSVSGKRSDCMTGMRDEEKWCERSVVNVYQCGLRYPACQ